jgi:hypothetical protein
MHTSSPPAPPVFLLSPSPHHVHDAYNAKHTHPLSHSTAHLTNKSQPTGRRPNLRDAVNPTHRPLVLRMILRPTVRTSSTRHATINRCEARGADIKISKLIEVDFDSIRWVLLGNLLDACGSLFHLRVTGAVKQGVGEVERRVELLVLVGKVHGCRQGDGFVRAFELGDGEVGGEFERALLVCVGEGGDVGCAFEEFAAL